MKIILQAITGSRLYGLDTEDSDTDYGGVFVEPTENVLGVSGFRETFQTKDPDSTLHEVGKFIKLCCSCNPTILDHLFCPEYLILEEEGQWIVEQRENFLSNRVIDSFGGYAYQQAKKLMKRSEEGMEGFGPKTKNRYPKHARHCFRLLKKGRELLETGTMNPLVENREELFEIGRLPKEELFKRFEEEYASFREIKGVLPQRPNMEAVNFLLLRIRLHNLKSFTMGGV